MNTEGGRLVKKREVNPILCIYSSTTASDPGKKCTLTTIEWPVLCGGMVSSHGIIYVTSYKWKSILLRKTALELIQSLQFRVKNCE